MLRTSPATTISVTVDLPRRRPGRRAFTLIELTLVIAVLALMVALVVPNLLAIKRSRDLLNLEAAIGRLPAEARNAAVKSGRPVTLQITGDALVMQQSQTDASTAQTNGTSAQMKQVSLGSGIVVENAQQNGQPVDPSAWLWTAYPDGTADSGGLEFTEGSAVKSLVIPRDMNARWVDGALPDTSQDKWTAGELLQRG